MRSLAFLPPELVEDGFEDLLAEYYDLIRFILGPERVYLLEIFIQYFQSHTGKSIIGIYRNLSELKLLFSITVLVFGAISSKK
jgi:hypothetical protein